jgi:hypothetical protein
MWANMSTTDPKAQRKPIAERLYWQGFHHGADRHAACRDQRHDQQRPQWSVSNGNNPPRPRGGRPKGNGKARKSPDVAARHEKIVTLSDAGLSTHEIAEKVGVGDWMVSRVLLSSAMPGKPLALSSKEEDYPPEACGQVSLSSSSALTAASIAVD